MVSFTLFSFLAALSVVIAAPHKPQLVHRSNGPAVPDSYIVVLKDNVDRAAHLASVSSTFSVLDNENTFEINHEYSTVLNGYSGVLKGAALDMVLADPNVAFVSEDSIASIHYFPESQTSDSNILATRADAPGDGTDGKGVDIYGLDTGIYIGHSEFEGRAVWGATFAKNSTDMDGNGHGTHTASTAVGKTYGVAKAANVIAVKVLNDKGSGAYSDVTAGIDWVVKAIKASGRPSVATMSLTGPANDAVDLAVQIAIMSGLHFTLAAGNEGKDASNSSPARVKEANTVGAVDSAGKMANFSNTGSVVDVFALGVSVKAAWIGGTDATNTVSGTSMSTPAVAGILAVALSKSGSIAPVDLSAALIQNAKPIVTGEPDGTTDLLAELF